MKKDIMFVGVSICLLILLGIGLSYSMWNMRVSQDTNNVISTTDCFDITLVNQSNAIKLDNAYPITDTKGKKLTPFTFSINNVCDTAVAYTVSLENLEGTTLASDYLKVMVNNDEPLLLNSLSTTDVVNTTSIESRVLDTGTLFKNNTKEYSIRLWIDYNTTLDDLNNETKVLKSKIIIKGVPSNEKEPLANHVTSLSKTDTVNLATDDPDNNVRYIGADPSNYVYFNCSDYNNPTADTCELWRIIGVFNNVTKRDGSKENLVKIIRADSLGNYSWDYKKNGVGTSTKDYGSNDWSDSQLMMMLNPTNYLKSSYTNSSDIISSGSQQLYSKMGSYYNGTKGCKPAAVASGASFSCTEVDFTSTGLKNDTTRNAIEEVVWNLGGTNTYNSASNGLASHFYGYERGTTVYTGRPTTWTGKIGLMYPSDYGYATSGGTTKDRAACLAKELYSWRSSDFSDCKGNDYLLDTNNWQWTLAPYSALALDVFGVAAHGSVSYGDASDTMLVRPVLFLKSNIQVVKGTGAKSNPYTLKMQ
ncbi:MAG: hypothetical protein SPK36_03730 [Bacilli bacterium]|nr:hypothetical protein [Bacilli bacterium]